MGDSDTYRTLLAAGSVVTATGSTIVRVPMEVDASTLDLVVNITAVSGTSPTIRFAVARDTETKRGTWPSNFGTATQTATLSTTGRTVLSVPSAIDPLIGACPPFVRVTWTVTGTTPSFTLGLYIE